MAPRAKALAAKPQHREFDPGTRSERTDFLNMSSDFTTTSVMYASRTYKTANERLEYQPETDR